MPLFVYTLNRFTDLEEDEQNTPQRVAFIRTHGTSLLAVSGVLYLGGLWLVLARNLMTVIFTVFPVVVGVLYSVSRIKYILFMKNLLVGLSWGTIPFVVAAYVDHPWTREILLLAIFFSVMMIISTIVFDIKDIEGDRAAGIRTLPNLYGLRWTQLFCHTLNGSLGLAVSSLVLTGIVSWEFSVLVVVNLYVFSYLLLADPDRGPLYYGVIVEGAYIILMMVVGGLYLLR
jgi:4-hydroxybenzoate polyprenyltransferase